MLFCTSYICNTQILEIQIFIKRWLDQQTVAYPYTAVNVNEVKWKLLSHVQLCDLMDYILSIEFSKPEYWSA